MLRDTSRVRAMHIRKRLWRDVSKRAIIPQLRSNPTRSTHGFGRRTHFMGGTMRLATSFRCFHRILFRLVPAIIAWTALPPLVSVAHAQQTTITGRVTDAASGRPIAGARITVLGTNFSAVTTSDGAYTIRATVPAGAILRASSLGYGEERRPIPATGQSSVMNFAMKQVAVAISGVVVTATGEQQ